MSLVLLKTCRCGQLWPFQCPRVSTPTVWTTLNNSSVTDRKPVGSDGVWTKNILNIYTFLNITRPVLHKKNA